MKIEKINDNQIRCTLSKQELEERQIKISELAYGSEKAKDLFQDMIEQANDEFGFEVDDMPIMVEAIPLSGENLVLQITKVEYPDELDPRFSKFSEPNEEGKNEKVFADIHAADEIVSLFEKLTKEENSQTKENDVDVNDKDELPVKLSQHANLTKMFEIPDFEVLERVSRVLAGFYKGNNSLYKDLQRNCYVLVLQKSKHTPQEFNKVCNIISEYAIAVKFTPAIGAYLKEHGKLIIKGNAIQLYGEL